MHVEWVKAMNAWRTITLGLLTAVVVFSLERLLTRDSTPSASSAARRVASDRARSARRAAGGSELGSGSGLAEVERRRAESPASSDGAAERLRELSASSETYRNTTLLIAIRDAGFTCTDVIAVDRSAGEVGAWRVSCRDAQAYWLGLDEAGRIVINPIAYGDALPWTVIDGGQREAPAPQFPPPPGPR